MCVATACRPTKNDYDSTAARHSSSAPGSAWALPEPNLPWLVRRLLPVGERCTGRSLKPKRRTLMKLHQSIAVCLALMAGVTADGCFAQSAASQGESVAVGTTPQDPAVTAPAITPVP